MKDKDGFTMPCIHSEWQVSDNHGNKDFVCTMFKGHICYGDDLCRYYKEGTYEEKTNDKT